MARTTIHTDIARVAAGRNDDLLAFADAVNAYMSTEGATIDKLRTIVNKSVKPASKPARKAQPRKSAPTMPAKRWQDEASSKSQQQYIPALAARKGQHSVRNTKTGELIPLTAEGVATMSKGFASKTYYALKGMQNLTVNNRHADSRIDWDTDGRDDSGYAADDHTSRWIERIESNFA